MNPSVSSPQNTVTYQSPFEDGVGGDAQPLAERTYPGLHDEIMEQLLKHVRTRGPALDLGCGTGAWLSRLQRLGFSEVLGCDSDVKGFGLERSLLVASNLDHAFSHKIKRRFDLITAIETIEHVENPAGFLREARQLINPGGFMFVTTPNVECIQSRLRFLMQGKLRAFEDDNTADPTNISPVLTSLMPRIAERSGWKVQERIDLLKNKSRASVQLLCQMLDPFLEGKAKQGDCHLFILRPAEGPRL